ncbi:putative mitochondrial protein [Vitis vinifera]|uniref:Putative mitochondrial protein n=1 Tax=Vitis vinifera TaxID=29760 RepID=A0A438FCQ4_VITVI|nr:putative mitochondrial protein [Vitis vinifera]
MLTRSKTGTLKKKAFTVSALAEPCTIKQALQDPLWRQAMEVEYIALLKTNTWTLVPPPPYGNVTGYKWVF